MRLHRTAAAILLLYFHAPRVAAAGEPRDVSRLKDMRRIFHKVWVGVLVCGFIGLAVVIMGIATLGRGQLHYQNYWGGEVFAPFAIIIGVAFAVVCAWKWKSIVRPSKQLKGKARRDAERAAQTKFPIDSYRKW